MALSKPGLKALIIAEMEGQGITTSGEFAYAGKLAEAIANAVVDHFQTSGEIETTSGAPDGEHTGVIH